MDRIAVISDIHGNISALETVLSDIKRRGINRIMCLGDIAGKGPGSDTAVDIIREKCEIVLKGNWDYIISEKCDNDVLRWHRKKLGSERLEYLRQLPLYTEFYLSGRLIRLFHAAPEDVFHRVHADAATEEKLKLFEAPAGKTDETDIAGYGDIHGAYVQNFKKKTIFNTGSVGNPLDITQASYAVIEGDYGSRDISGMSINLIKLPYDIEYAVHQAVESGMPELEPYIMELRTARYRGLK